MFEGVLSAIDDLINEIYTIDQNQLDKKFVVFIDKLNGLISELAAIDFQVDISEETLVLQNCYEKRDLVELADYLLYNLKISILELQDMVMSEV